MKALVGVKTRIHLLLTYTNALLVAVNMRFLIPTEHAGRAAFAARLPEFYLHLTLPKLKDAPYKFLDVPMHCQSTWVALLPYAMLPARKLHGR